MHIERLTRLDLRPYMSTALEGFLRLTPEMMADAFFVADAAARELEDYASLALLNQTIRVTLDVWPDDSWFSLPIAPYLSGSPLTVTVDGVPITEFTVIAGQRPALCLAEMPPDGRVVIDYRAGFGSTVEAIPADIQHAIVDQAAASFEVRGDGNPKGFGMSPHMARVAGRYRRVAL